MSLQRRKRFRKRTILPLSRKQKVLKCQKLERRRTVYAKRRCPSQDALGGHERRGGLTVAAQPVSPRSSQLSRSNDTDVDVGLDFSAPVKLFESLVSPISLETFFAEYWEKKPLLVKRNGSLASSYGHFFSLDYLNHLVKDCHIVFGRNVNVCRYVNHRRQSLNGNGRVKPEELATLWNEKKATIQFHQPQQFKVGVIWWKSLPSPSFLLPSLPLPLLSLSPPLPSPLHSFLSSLPPSFFLPLPPFFHPFTFTLPPLLSS